MKEYNQDANDAEYAAWQEWKAICSILRCSEEHRRILAARVTKAFYNKLQILISDGRDGLFTPASRLTWAYEFDAGIIEKDQRWRKQEGNQTKKWKDWLFNKVAESPDSPIKVIRGKLTAQKGIINDIAELYLRRNYPLIWERKKGHDVSSMEEKRYQSDDESGTTIGDTLEDKKALKTLSRLEVSAEQLLRRLVGEKLMIEHAAILLVFLVSHVRQLHGRTKLALGIPELLQFVQLSKTSCHDRLNNVILPMMREVEDSFWASGAIDFVISLLQERLKSEKRAQALLSRVEKALLEV